MISGQATVPGPAPAPGPVPGPIAAAPAPGPEPTTATARTSATDSATATATATTATTTGAATATATSDVADAGTGRDAILRAARRAFTQRPYADVTIRGIAADAGVSPSLVVKHFGRKEELFNTVADFGPAAAAELFDAPSTCWAATWW